MGIKLTYGPSDINFITAYILTSLLDSSVSFIIKSNVSILTMGYYIILTNTTYL